jgi:hypothetical protein
MIIIDNFVKDLDFLQKIESSEEFWQPGYQWYDGWWSVQPSNIREFLIQQLWADNSPHAPISCSGFEHWVGDLSEDGKVYSAFDMEFSLPLHFDKDEAHFNQTKDFSFPIIGTIFYPCREIDEMEGGMLHYWENHDASQLKDGQITGLGNDCEIIKPKFNRLIIFDASKLHAVAKVTKGRRRAIAINLWLNKPLTFSEQFSAPLTGAINGY